MEVSGIKLDIIRDYLVNGWEHCLDEDEAVEYLMEEVEFPQDMKPKVTKMVQVWSVHYANNFLSDDDSIDSWIMAHFK
jgi:hypothetical protein